MGIPEDDKLLPEHYFCERCKPQNHKDLLAAVAKGERPWEAGLQLLKEQEKLKKSKKSRKSKGGRSSAVGTESEPATTPKPVVAEVATPQPVTSSRRRTAQPDSEIEPQVRTFAFAASLHEIIC